MHKFEIGDKVFLVDLKKHSNLSTHIIECRFNAYTDSSYEKASILNTANKRIILNSWAIHKSREDATKFALTYLVSLKEEIELDVEGDISENYLWLEDNYPELILKYMSFIKNR